MSNPEHLVEHIERRQRNEFSSSLTTSLTAKSLEKDLRETLKLGLTSNGSPEQVKLIDVSADQNSSDTTGNLKSSSSVPVPPVLTPAMLESSLPGLPTTPNGGMNVSSSGQSPHSVATPFMVSISD